MNFSKMLEMGNAIVIVDAVTQNIHLFPETIRRLSSNLTGIGFDYLIMVEPPYSPDVDFHYQIFDAKGKLTDQHSIGMASLARFLQIKNLIKKREFVVSSIRGTLMLNIRSDNKVIISLGTPVFEPQRIPFKAAKEEKTYIIRAQEQTFFCGVVALDIPHCVITVSDIINTDVVKIGQSLSQHERLPENSNIIFMQLIDKQNIKLRCYYQQQELTNINIATAGAAVAVAVNQGVFYKDSSIKIIENELDIIWNSQLDLILITSSAIPIFDGFIHL